MQLPALRTDESRAAGVRSGHALHFVERPAGVPSRQASEAGEPDPVHHGPSGLPGQGFQQHVTFGHINIVGEIGGGEWDAEQFHAASLAPQTQP